MLKYAISWRIYYLNCFYLYSKSTLEALQICLQVAEIAVFAFRVRKITLKATQATQVPYNAAK